MNSFSAKDLYRYEGKRSARLSVQLKYRFFVPGFTYSYYYRKAQCCKNRIVRVLAVILLKLTSYITGIQIPYITKIGYGLKFSHWGTVIINPNAIIGKNFTVSSGVVIGYSSGKNEGVPVIGDNVIINANAVVVGGIEIGNDVLIAPGAFVNFDVPKNSIVIGNPGRIIRKENSPTARYIIYPV